MQYQTMQRYFEKQNKSKKILRVKESKRNEVMSQRFVKSQEKQNLVKMRIDEMNMQKQQQIESKQGG